MTRKFLLLMLAVCSSALEQTKDVANGWLSDLAWPHDYVLKRASSFDRSGGNDDFRKIATRETLTLLDAARPAIITHIWITLGYAGEMEKFHLK